MDAPRLYPAAGEVTIERQQAGRPHAGKVFAAVQAHSDDIPFYCAGTLAKLVAEGYDGYLIQTSNDEKCGPTPRIGDTIAANERDVDELARVLGLQRVFHLSYRNHRMDGDSALELRCRLILLFRLLQVDAVFTFNPWGVNEENPDHWVTARAVEAACWMAGADKDYPEQLAAGLKAPQRARTLLLGRARGAGVQPRGGCLRPSPGQGGGLRGLPHARTGRIGWLAAAGAPGRQGAAACQRSVKATRRPIAPMWSCSCWSASARWARSTAWAWRRPFTTWGRRRARRWTTISRRTRCRCRHPARFDRTGVLH